MGHACGRSGKAAWRAVVWHACPLNTVAPNVPETPTKPGALDAKVLWPVTTTGTLLLSVAVTDGFARWYVSCVHSISLSTLTADGPLGDASSCSDRLWKRTRVTVDGVLSITEPPPKSTLAHTVKSGCPPHAAASDCAVTTLPLTEPQAWLVESDMRGSDEKPTVVGSPVDGSM